MLSLERMVISMNLKPMLNAYPDSLGGTLGDIVTLLKQDDMKGFLYFTEFVSFRSGSWIFRH